MSGQNNPFLLRKAQIHYRAQRRHQYVYFLDVHESVHRDTTMKLTNKMHYMD